MKTASLFNILLTAFLLALTVPGILFISGCANIIPPSGGPRDSLPPVMIRAVPPDSSLNFKAKTVEFTFDEYIQLQNIQENLLVSPTPEVNPLVESKLKTLTVKLKEDLEPGTTYSLNFGKAIRDVNESNVLNGFTYLFSTGDIIDSLELSGNVILAETGGVDTTLVVMLHRSPEDSAVIKDRPRYVTKLDGKGNFHFRYLPQGTYYLYALKDEGGTRKYFSTEQLFAFADSAVIISEDTAPVTLYAFAETKAPPTTPVIGFGGGRATQNRGDERRLRYGNNLQNDMQDLLGEFFLSFDQPLKTLDTSKLQLSTDSAFNPVAVYSWEADTTGKKLNLKINWRENTLYNLILDIDFAEDSSGRKLLKTDTLHFTTRKQTDYGSVRIIFQNLDTLNHHALQFIQGNRVVKSFSLQNNVFQQSLFNPGEYELRMLYDRNENNRWDPGEFFGKRIQPEIAIPIDRKVNIRPGFENEFDIEAPPDYPGK